jgi:hypothetical protein
VTPEQRAGIEARLTVDYDESKASSMAARYMTARSDVRALLAALAEAEQREAALVEALNEAEALAAAWKRRARQAESMLVVLYDKAMGSPTQEVTVAAQAIAAALPATGGDVDS